MTSFVFALIAYWKFSQFKLSFLGHCKNLLSSILQSASSRNCFDGAMSLHLDLRILFPATNVHRHIIKGDLLLQKFIHLSLDRILIACFHKRGRVVDAAHRVEVFVLSRVHTAHSEVIIEEILAVTSIWHTIVHQKLQNDLNCRFAME